MRPITATLRLIILAWHPGPLSTDVFWSGMRHLRYPYQDCGARLVRHYSTRRVAPLQLVISVQIGRYPTTGLNVAGRGQR